MMKDLVFGHGTTTSILGSQDRSKSRQVRRRRGKVIDKSGFKRTGRAFPERWSEEDCAWWSNRKRGKKASRRAIRAFGSVDSALAHQKRVQAVFYIHTMARARNKKVWARKVLIHNQDFIL